MREAALDNLLVFGVASNGFQADLPGSRVSHAPGEFLFINAAFNDGPSGGSRVTACAARKPAKSNDCAGKRLQKADKSNGFRLDSRQNPRLVNGSENVQLKLFGSCC
jgi:hypothetical protein